VDLNRLLYRQTNDVRAGASGLGLEHEDARFLPGGYGRADPEPAGRAKKRTTNGYSLPGSGSRIGLLPRNIRTR
jgi:hypothetical protein